MRETHLTDSTTRTFAPTTLARFDEIAELIKAHEDNIAHSQFVAGCRNTLRQMGQKMIPALSCKPEDEARLPRTVANLQQQIEVLNYECEVLKRYGR